MPDQHDDEVRPLRSYHTILKHQIVTGLTEVRRPNLGLFLSSLSAGLDIGFSLLLIAVVVTILGNEAESLTGRLLAANMYSIGFILVILGRSELFTEHTALAVLPVLDRRATLLELARVWAIVYVGNLIGAGTFAAIVYFVGPSLGAVEPWALERIAWHLVDHPWWVILLSAMLAGWLMGELAWIMGAARDTVSQVLFVWVVTAAIGLAGLHHVVVGTAEVIAGMLAGSRISILDFLSFLFWATLGNALGGVIFVAIIKYGHASQTADHDEQEMLDEGVNGGD